MHHPRLRTSSSCGTHHSISLLVHIERACGQERATLTALRDGLALRWQLDEHHVAQRLLGVLGDADRANVGRVVEFDPLMVDRIPR